MDSRTVLWTTAFSALLAACAAPAPNGPSAGYPPVQSEPPVDAAATPSAPASRYRPGVGTIESATVLSLSSAPAAAAGGTAGPATSATMAYRLKMADGTTQDVVQAGERFEVGDRVEMTREGRLVRP